MAFGLTVRRGGPYNRLAEPAWADPLDISYSQRFGGRWNAPGSYWALYLNPSLAMARVQVDHKLAGHPYGVEDLDPAEQHDLVDVQVLQDDYQDCVTEPGLAAVGLPDQYPLTPRGNVVPWRDCQAVGATSRADGRPGVACRSASVRAPAGEEELAVFDTHAPGVTMTGRTPFADWYLA
jgi:RES domain-containing protein